MSEKFRKYHEMFYNRYSNLANIMASKVNRLDALGLEKEDIQQEFRLKIWTSIPDWVEKWGDYRRGGIKPVPLRYYLLNVLSNKVKDYYKFIDREKNNILMSEIAFDYSGQESIDTFIDFENCELILHGVDIMRGMTKNGKKAFVQHVKGHEMKNIEKMFEGKVKNVRGVINEQLDFIRNYHSDLIEKKDNIFVLDYSKNN